MKGTLRKAGFEKNAFDGESALWDVGGVLQQTHVARHECGSGESDDLPEGKIPGHHCENRADRKVADKGLLRACFHDFVGHEPFNIFGVVTAGAGALDGFGDGGFISLAHLERHQMPKFVFVALEDFGGSEHALRALGEGRIPLRFESSHCLLHFLFDL